MACRTGRLSRSVWSVADQGLSSLSNLVFGIIAARNLDVATFGAVGLALAIYAIVLNATRGLASTPLVVTSADGDPVTIRTHAAASITMTCLASAALGVLLCTAAFLMSSGTRAPMIALGLGLPMLLGQDHIRFVFVTLGRPDRAAITDAVWVVLLLPGLLLHRTQWHDGALTMTLFWAFGAGVSLVAGLYLAGVVPQFAGVAALVRRQWALSWRYCLEATIVGAGRQAAVLATATVAGVAAVSGIRAAALLMGPYTVIAGGLIFMSTAEALRILARSPARAVRFLAGLSSALAAVALVIAVGFRLIPTWLGTSLLADSWPQARGIILFVGLWTAASGVQAGAYAGLNAIRAASSSLSLRATFLAITVAATLAGAAFGGPRSALICAAVVELLSGLAAWRSLLKQLEIRRRTAPVTEPEQVAPHR